LVASVVIGLTAATAAAAETWPQRMVRLFVPVGAGSATDTAARIYADRLAERWKQTVVVENRPGADGLIGVSAFIAARDDHALLFSFAAPISVYPVVREKLPYDPARDLVPISSATDSFGSLAVPTSLNISSLAQLVAYARARPGKLNSHATSGVFPYLLAGFLQSEGLDVMQISYREQNLAMQDLGEGRLDLLMTPVGAILPVVQAGKARFVAVTNSRRSLTVPDVPTVQEAGYPELAFEGFQGVFGSRISHELRDRIAADVAAVAADPVVVARLDAIGQLAHTTTPTEFAGMIADQRAKIADIVRRTGMKQ
jgi:tripartite-type tricarboxylate transporter receptor subunit TctC